MSDAAKKQCEILDEAQRRFGHEVSQWRAAGESVLNEPISSALDRASIPAMFNVVGDELRKLTNHIIQLESQLTALRAEADKGRETHRAGVATILERLDRAGLANLSRFDGMEARFNLIELIIKSALAEQAAWHLTWANSLQAALEERMGLINKRWRARKKKQERKRGRK